MDNTKPNDFFATRFFQPEITIADMEANGITPDNSTLKSKDYYQGLPEVQQAFSKDGNFDENAFNQFYNISLSQYNKFAAEQFEKEFIDNYEVDPYDWTAPIGSKVRDVAPTIVFDKNPLGESQGIRNLTLTGESPFSIAELAQRNTVKDEEGNDLGWTPNEKGGFFKAISRPNLVLATYDEDTVVTDPNTGRNTLMKKGQYKLDENGLPYYETLGDREMYGKQTLSYWDTITVDGSKLNKFDFFDTDDKTQSIGGTITKMALSIAPFFLPGKYGKIYGLIRAGIGAANTIPVLGKTANSIFGGSENEFGKSLNHLEAYLNRFKGGVSEESQNKMVTFENFGNLISQISGQLFEQRAVGMIPAWINKHGDKVKNAELGKKLATGYMALTSSIDSYGQFKQAGTTDTMAAIGFLANAGALYGLMQIDYFNDWLFKGSWLDENSIRYPIQHLVQRKIKPMFNSGKLEEPITKQGIAKYYNIFKNFLLNDYRQVLTGTAPTVASQFVGGAVREGVEEVMEEGVLDVSKGLTKLGNILGVVSSTSDSGELDFGWSGKEALQRYAMAFGGGMIGGSIFQAADFKTRFAPLLNAEDRDDIKQIMQYFLTGHKQDVYEELDRLHRKGRLGNKNLSGEKFTMSNLPGEEGELLAEASVQKSQNDVIYELLKNQFDQLDKMLNEEGFINIKQDVKFNKIQELLPDVKAMNDASKRAMILWNNGVETLMLDDLSELAADIVQVRGQIEEKRAKHGDDSESKAQAQESDKNNKELIRLQEKLKKLRERRDNIILGTDNDIYLNAVANLNDPLINKVFGKPDQEQIANIIFNANYHSLTAEQKEIVNEKLSELVDTKSFAKQLMAKTNLYQEISLNQAQPLMLLNERLKGLKPDEFEKQNVLGQFYVANKIRQEQLEEIIEQLNAKVANGTISEEEIETLNNSKEELENLIKNKKNLEAATKHTPMFLTNIHTNEKGESKLDSIDDDIITKLNAEGLTPEEQWEGIKGFSSEIINYYATVASANGVLTNENALNLLMQEVRKHYNFNDRVYELISNVETPTGDAIDSYMKSPDDYNLLLMKIKELINVLNNPKKFMELHDELVNFLKEQDFDEIMIDETLRIMLPRFHEDLSMYDYLKNLQGFRDKIEFNPALKLFEDFIISLTDDKESQVQLIEFLNGIFKDFENSKDVEEFTFNDPNAPLFLKSILRHADTLYAIVHGAYSGVNGLINPFRQSEQKELFAELDDNTGRILLKNLSLISTKIQTLLDLHELNYADKLKTDKKTEAVMTVANLNALMNIYDPAFQQRFGFSLKEIWENIDKGDLSPELTDINENNFEQYSRFIYQFENDVHEAFVKAISDPTLNLNTNQKVIDAFFSPIEGKLDLFTDLWKSTTTQLTSDPEKATTEPLSIAMYLSRICFIDTNNIRQIVRQGLINEDLKFVPTYGQMEEILNTIATIHNHNFYNYSIKTIYDNIPEDKIDKQDKLAYLKNKVKLFNFNAIFGVAGSGKTVVCPQTLKYIMSKLEEKTDTKTKYILVGKTAEQRDKLKSDGNFTDDESVSFTTNEILEKIIGKPGLTSEDFGEDPVTRSTRLKPGLDIKDDSKIYDKAIIVIDEVALHNQGELALLSKYAQRFGYHIVGLGDRTQINPQIRVTTAIDGTELKNSEGKPISVSSNIGIEDCAYWTGSTLTHSLRTRNGAKDYNANALAYVVQKIDRWYQQHPWADQSDVTNELNDILKDPIRLKYYQSPHRLVGEKSVNTTEELKQHIDDILEGLGESGTILIVTDKNNYNSYKADPRIQVTNDINNINGAEATYVFIDVTWNQNSSEGNYNQLRKFYTATQRSQIGTVFVNNYLTVSTAGSDGLNITFESDPLYNYNLNLSTKILDSYKQWKLKVWDGLDGVTVGNVSEEIKLLNDSEDDSSDDSPTGGSNAAEGGSVIPTIEITVDDDVTQPLEERIKRLEKYFNDVNNTLIEWTALRELVKSAETSDEMKMFFDMFELFNYNLYFPDLSDLDAIKPQILEHIEKQIAQFPPVLDDIADSIKILQEELTKSQIPPEKSKLNPIPTGMNGAVMGVPRKNVDDSKPVVSEEKRDPAIEAESKPEDTEPKVLDPYGNDDDSQPFTEDGDKKEETKIAVNEPQVSFEQDPWEKEISEKRKDIEKKNTVIRLDDYFNEIYSLSFFENEKNSIDSLYSLLKSIDPELEISSKKYQRLIHGFSDFAFYGGKQPFSNFVKYINNILNSDEVSDWLKKPVDIKYRFEQNSKDTNIYLVLNSKVNGKETSAKILIGKTNEHITGWYNGGFEVLFSSTRVRSNQRQSLEELKDQHPWITFSKQYALFTKSKDVSAATPISERTKTYLDTNSGKVFVFAQPRLWNPINEKDLVSMQRQVDGNYWMYHKDSINEAFVIQKSRPLSDIILFAKAYRSLNKMAGMPEGLNMSSDEAKKALALLKEISLPSANQYDSQEDKRKFYSEYVSLKNQILSHYSVGALNSLVLSEKLVFESEDIQNSFYDQIWRNIEKWIKRDPRSSGYKNAITVTIKKKDGSESKLYIKLSNNNGLPVLRSFTLGADGVSKELSYPLRETILTAKNSFSQRNVIKTAVLDLINASNMASETIKEFDPNVVRLEFSEERTKDGKIKLFTDAVNSQIYTMFRDIPNVDKVDNALNANEFFKNNVYISEPANRPIGTNAYGEVLDQDTNEKVTDIEKILPPIIGFDRSQVSVEEAPIESVNIVQDAIVETLRDINSKIDKSFDLNEILDYDPDILNKPLDEALSTLSFILNELTSIPASSGKRPRFIVNGTVIDIQYEYGLNDMLQQAFKGAEIQLNYENVLNSGEFSVTLNDETKHFILKYQEGKWIWYETNTFDSYANAMNIVKSLNDSSAETYLQAMLYDMDYANEAADSYLSQTHTSEVEEAIANYLIDRLSKNEC